MQKNKVVCTIGPASWDPAVLKQMIDSGMTVARINGAFADVAELKRVEDLIRSVSNDVALMLDIKGTEVRLNKFGEDFQVAVGDILEIGNNDTFKIYPRTYPELHNDLEVGANMVIDDGNITATLKEKSNGVMKIEITKGGTFKQGKSINTPGIMTKNPPLTSTDIEQIAYAKSAGWEFVAASFVRTKEDALLVQKECAGAEIQLIAKIEDQHGVDNLDEILEIVDGVMVARGDLGVEVPYQNLPLIQKEMIAKANHAAKPVITATQMLESMVNNDRPTRAEISDVANAVLDGTDATMLSAESSAGKYPVQAVQAMTKIAIAMEAEIEAEELDVHSGDEQVDALCYAAYNLIIRSDNIQAVVTNNAAAARMLSVFNLPVKTMVAAKSDVARRQLSSLTKGVTAFNASENWEQDALNLANGKVVVVDVNSSLVKVIG